MDSTPFKSILVPVDGSASSDAAVAFALRLAGPQGSLTFANAVDIVGLIDATVTPYGGDPAGVLDALESGRRDVLAKASASAVRAGITATTVDLAGPAVSTIVDLAATLRPDAIVMGSTGREGLARVALGSTSDGVVRRVEVPAFIVRAGCELRHDGAPPIRRILAGVDGSEGGGDAAAFAVRVAAAYGATVTFTHVEDGGDASAAARALVRARSLAVAAGVPCDVATGYGRPGDAIATAAGTMHADLVVAGTHGRRGAAHLIFGSVAGHVAATSPVPVAVVHPKVAAALVGVG